MHSLSWTFMRRLTACAALIVLWGTSAHASPLRNGEVITLRTLGHIDGPRWLDGRTGDGTVGLAWGTYWPYTGTQWRVYDFGGGVYAFETLGHIAGPRWLDGRTGDGSVGLAPGLYWPYTGTFWRVREVYWNVFEFECLGHIQGPRWLDGRTGDGTVGLSYYPYSQDPYYTGSWWQVIH